MDLQMRQNFPGGLVTLDKGGIDRRAIVGIINSRRIIAQGFDLNDSGAPHYRMVDYGPFGVAVAAALPVEVTVVLDGVTLSHASLQPAMTSQNPANEFRPMDPQMHYLCCSQTGDSFLFNPPSEDMSIDEIVTRQLNPSPFDVRFAFPGEPFEGLGNSQLETDPWALSQSGDAERTPEDDTASDTAGDTVVGAGITALTHGLVVVGVRFLEFVTPGNPPLRPDDFGYVLFQLNPARVHSVARARLLNKLRIPSREQLIAADQMRGIDLSPHLGTGRCCGLTHHHEHH